jgi:hypothetical protein
VARGLPRHLSQANDRSNSVRPHGQEAIGVDTGMGGGGAFYHIKPPTWVPQIRGCLQSRKAWGSTKTCGQR